jgi:hypothetical protein
MKFKEINKVYVLPILTFFIVLTGLTFSLNGCTEESRTKKWGGSMTIELEPGRKLIDATWKDGSDIWYTTRKMLPNENADTIHFHQHKGGMISLTGNGEVIFIEKKF